MPGMRGMALVTTALPIESDALGAALGSLASVELGAYRALRCETGWGVVDVVPVGAGPVAAAAGTAHCLGVRPYDLVVCAGIAGRYPSGADNAATAERAHSAASAGPDIVVADRVVLDGFGAESAQGLLDAAEIGLGASAHDLDPALTRLVADRTGGALGTVVTVLAATGTPARARERAQRWGATAEAMEGAGVHAAAVLDEVAFLEVRAISNEVGVRDKQHWDIAGAVARLGQSLTGLFAEAWR